MSAALITATVLGILTLLASALAFVLPGADDRMTHATLGIFGTLLVLLAHSMTMFYMIGKGKAIREAVAEAGLSRQYVARMSAARRPVFSWATLAMAVTMLAAILGGGADTGALPPAVHSVPAWLAIVINMAALRVEVRALRASAALVREIDAAFDPRTADAG